MLVSQRRTHSGVRTGKHKMNLGYLVVSESNVWQNGAGQENPRERQEKQKQMQKEKLQPLPKEQDVSRPTILQRQFQDSEDDIEIPVSRNKQINKKQSDQVCNSRLPKASLFIILKEEDKGTDHPVGMCDWLSVFFPRDQITQWGPDHPVGMYDWLSVFFPRDQITQWGPDHPVGLCGTFCFTCLGCQVAADMNECCLCGTTVAMRTLYRTRYGIP
ncbi:hypothetical protein STEG23_006513, partial [Scotinomys teguina]